MHKDPSETARSIITVSVNWKFVAVLMQVDELLRICYTLTAGKFNNVRWNLCL
jgi:hypothetical protein